MHVSRSIAAVAAALVISAGSAEAQMINFNTAGVFSGAGCSAVGGVALVSSWCDAAGGLTANQSVPTAGAASTSASVTGTLSAIQGGLLWGPVDPSTFFIGQVNYTISRDQLTNGVRIDPPGVGGVASDAQTIRGFVTTVPEPSTYLLMASGLAAIGMMARRRRQV
jgi:hypothetical protein